MPEEDQETYTQREDFFCHPFLYYKVIAFSSLVTNNRTAKSVMFVVADRKALELRH